MALPMLVVGPNTVPTQIFSLSPRQLQVATLVPLCLTWMPYLDACLGSSPEPLLLLPRQPLFPIISSHFFL